MFGAPASRVRVRRGWWLGPELAAAAALLVLSIPVLSTAPGQKFKQEVGARASAVLESSAPEEHHNHGHQISLADNVVCGVEIFGTEPAGAKTADAVTRVYGYYFCAVGPDGTPYLRSSRMDGPVVITFGPPPVVQIARSGAGYDGRVRAMMPDQYEPLCFGGLRDRSVAADVRRRFIDLAGAG